MAFQFRFCRFWRTSRRPAPLMESRSSISLPTFRQINGEVVDVELTGSLFEVRDRIAAHIGVPGERISLVYGQRRLAALDLATAPDAMFDGAADVTVVVLNQASEPPTPETSDERCQRLREEHQQRLRRELEKRHEEVASATHVAWQDITWGEWCIENLLLLVVPSALVVLGALLCLMRHWSYGIMLSAYFIMLAWSVAWRIDLCLVQRQCLTRSALPSYRLRRFGDLTVLFNAAGFISCVVHLVSSKANLGVIAYSLAYVLPGCVWSVLVIRNNRSFETLWMRWRCSSSLV